MARPPGPGAGLSLGLKYGAAWPDLAGLAALVLLNPLVWFLGRSSLLIGHDAVAYITLGREMLQNGSLFIPSWGHLDTGLILPPLYPFLIGLASLATPRLLAASQLIGALALVLTSIPLYLSCRRIARPAWAFGAVFFIQLGLAFFSLGAQPGAEPLFLLFTAVAVWVFPLCRAAGPRGLLCAAGLGAVMGLAQLGRQFALVGAVFFLLALIFGLDGRRRWRAGLAFVLGFAALFAPYGLALYHQTGQHPLAQTFSLGRYAPQALDAPPPGEVALAAALHPPDYAAALAAKRQLRRLTPDARDMYAHAIWPGARGLGAQVRDNLVHPGRYLANLKANLGYLAQGLGWPFFALFCLAAFFRLVMTRRPGPAASWLIPGFVIFYLTALSLVTGLVERYVLVLVPLAFIFLAGEGGQAWERRARPWLGRWAGAAGLGVLALALALAPLFIRQPVYPALDERTSPYAELGRHIQPGQPVMSVLALTAYLAGGRFRVLPNDSLERVAVFARATGVEWLLVDRSGVGAPERRFYTQAPWYWSGPLALEHGGIELVELAGEGRLALFRFTGPR